MFWRKKNSTKQLMRKMSPNNSDNQVINENNSFNEIIDELKKLIIDEKRSISYTYVSQRFRVHVKSAIEILDKFVSEQSLNGNHLIVNYLLSGNNNNNENEIKMERFVIIEESAIEDMIDSFPNGFNKHIYCVSTKPSNDNSNDSNIELNFNDFDYVINSKSDLNEFHNLTYKKNPNIELRSHQRRQRFVPIVQKSEDCDEVKKSVINTNGTINKTKTKTNAKGKNAKKTKNSIMFSKINKEVKEEKIDESDDPFRSDSEEEMKTNEIIINNDSNDSNCLNEIENKQNEKEVKNNNKRNSDKQRNSSEDEEEIVKTKKKSNSKRFKRVRIISDSDSDESKEESAFTKFLKNKKEVPVVKVEEIQETHVDEDGYVVTKTVKKEVTPNDCKDLETKQKTESTKSNAKNSNDTKGKDKAKHIKNEEKTSDKKPKASKDTKSKNQSTILNFFKPKQVSA